uniref:Uncharacterized protein n=1 Tax=Spongospora subterranea TaxID=70186 RepID=A0A0H5R8E5_9EUKA|eukprot:CRZ10400.1 hypothetical protein [Spongospora subterranea]
MEIRSEVAAAQQLDIVNDGVLGSLTDHLALRRNSTLQRLLSSSDYECEELLYSARGFILQPMYWQQPEPEQPKEPITLCITNYRLLLFPPLIGNCLICNPLDQFPLEDILFVSLPFNTAPSQSSDVDFALRTDDCAIHFTSMTTLWLKVDDGGRSEFVNSLSQTAHQLINQFISLEHTEYADLIQQLRTGQLHTMLTQAKIARWIQQPLILTGTLLFQALPFSEWSSQPTIIDVTKFLPLFLSISRHSLDVFRSEQHMNIYRNNISALSSDMASVKEIDIDRCEMSTFRLEYDETNRDGIQIRCPDQELYFIMPTDDDGDPARTINEWMTAIKDRDLKFIKKMSDQVMSRKSSSVGPAVGPIEVLTPMRSVPESPYAFKGKDLISEFDKKYGDLTDISLKSADNHKE